MSLSPWCLGSHTSVLLLLFSILLGFKLQQVKQHVYRPHSFDCGFDPAWDAFGVDASLSVGTVKVYFDSVLGAPSAGADIEVVGVHAADGFSQRDRQVVLLGNLGSLSMSCSSVSRVWECSKIPVLP
ncbi:uncharacterized protein BJ171DRAFT_477020 [Polychytrium aggregatum]|uniref:uncharacterized protein n=1 Tax=Polychytrium aggregatum TaxID=110093 RepID=UPI0022FE7371|nr:uncharacterized protein BJ171DRAFT_477020 [Polychytrium aggregatum]KAI9201910.1 hypothetical protein BJ171DRAFT_477020 [Polychytrium aggregatum]